MSAPAPTTVGFGAEVGPEADQVVAAVQFDIDKTGAFGASIAYPGIEQKRLVGVDVAATYAMVERRLLDAARAARRAIPVLAREVDGSVVSFTIDSKLTGGLGTTGQMTERVAATQEDWNRAVERPRPRRGMAAARREQRAADAGREAAEQGAVRQVPAVPQPPATPTPVAVLPPPSMPVPPAPPRPTWASPPQAAPPMSPPPFAPPIAVPVTDDELPQMEALRAQRTQPRAAPAERGWQRWAPLLTAGLWRPNPSDRELELRSYRRAVTRSLSTSKTAVVANGKGGAPKTSTLVAVASIIAEERGGDIVLVDGNPFGGNLAMRAGANNPNQTLTIVDLVAAIKRGEVNSRAQLSNYLRDVEGQHFKVLASNEDPTLDHSLSAEEFALVHGALRKWFSLILVDTSNNINADAFRAAIDAADQLIVPLSLGQSSIEEAMKLMVRLQSWGRIDLARNAVAALVHGVVGPSSASRLSKSEAATQEAKARAQFAPPAGWMRELKDMPLDPVLAFDRPCEYWAMRRDTRDAVLEIAAAVFNGLGQ